MLSVFFFLSFPIAKLFLSRLAYRQDSMGKSDLVQIRCSERKQMKYRVECITPWLCSLSPRCAASCMAFYKGSIGMSMSPLLRIGLGSPLLWMSFLKRGCVKAFQCRASHLYPQEQKKVSSPFPFCLQLYSSLCCASFNFFIPRNLRAGLFWLFT